jgi:hypothetical protein
MTQKQVETEALKLEPQARAELAEKLLRSLEDLSEEEVERLWAEEAIRRDAELDEGTASMRDAEDIFRDARIRPDRIRILAIASQKRRPFYWRGRE